MQSNIAFNLKERDRCLSSLIHSFNKLLFHIYFMTRPVGGSEAAGIE